MSDEYPIENLQSFDINEFTTSLTHPCASSVSHLATSVEEPLFLFDFAMFDNKNELLIRRDLRPGRNHLWLINYGNNVVAIGYKVFHVRKHQKLSFIYIVKQLEILNAD